MDDMAERIAEIADLYSTGDETLDAFYSRWQDFLILLHPRENLLRAIRTFPCAMWIVIQTLRQKPNSSPAIAARQVIDTINDGQPAILILATFFRTTRSVIRASRRWPLEAIQGINNWRTACRYIHGLGVLGPLPPALDGKWELLQTRLPVIDLIARRFQLTRRELLNDTESATPVNHAPNRTWRAMRHLLQTLHALARHGASDQSNPMHGCIQAMFAAQPPASGLRLTLPCGWSAMELRNWNDIVEEALQMRHCIADFGEDAINGSVQIFSLRSSDKSDRATVMLDPPPACANTGMNIHIAGPDNDPVSLPALCALVELLQHICMADLQLSFS